MENYFRAKCKLFQGAGAAPPSVAVLNAEDRFVRATPLPQETKRWTYGFSESADVRAVDSKVNFQGIELKIHSPRGDFVVHSRLTGTFNLLNILAAVTTALALELDTEAIRAGILSCPNVPGRFERVDEGQPFHVFVDYAHTEAALQKLIETARQLAPKRIITVFGCGGDRDRSKRPKMGRVASTLSDLVIVTSDNPRSEDPLKIINDIVKGVHQQRGNYMVIPDRSEAIRKAVELAQPGDVVLIAGKGHETYQQFADHVLDFDDREVARLHLRKLRPSQQEARP